MNESWATAYIGLGGNQGDSKSILSRAIEAMEAHDGICLQAISAFYQNPPIGEIEQADFINAVVAIKTRLEPHDLLDVLQQIELDSGRIYDDVRWGPRTLDLDILLYADRVIDDPRLVIPHPEMGRRDFVLYPLHEISSLLDIPGLGKLADCLGACPDRGLVKVAHGYRG